MRSLCRPTGTTVKRLMHRLCMSVLTTKDDYANDYCSGNNRHQNADDIAGDTGDDGMRLGALLAQRSASVAEWRPRERSAHPLSTVGHKVPPLKRNGFRNTHARAVVPALQKQASDIKKILSEPTALTALLFVCDYTASVIESNSWNCRHSQYGS